MIFKECKEALMKGYRLLSSIMLGFVFLFFVQCDDGSSGDDDDENAVDQVVFEVNDDASDQDGDGITDEDELFLDNDIFHQRTSSLIIQRDLKKLGFKIIHL